MHSIHDAGYAAKTHATSIAWARIDCGCCQTSGTRPNLPSRSLWLSALLLISDTIDKMQSLGSLLRHSHPCHANAPSCSSSLQGPALHSRPCSWPSSRCQQRPSRPRRSRTCAVLEQQPQQQQEQQPAAALTPPPKRRRRVTLEDQGDASLLNFDHSDLDAGLAAAAGAHEDEDALLLQRSARIDASLSVHTVQWYPGHIARAERQLKEQLRMVDVVLEVRDARIPASTCHPQVTTWVGNKPRLVVVNRLDMVSKKDRKAWDDAFNAAGQRVFWTDGQAGNGTRALRDAAVALSTGINAKREARGLKPRPVRACVIGFPNIGKSALINRLLGRKVVESAPKPGVTRVLRWIRLGGELDLLDAPGVIPAAFNDQIAAQRLAMCNDIGEASYVPSLIAAALLVRVKALPAARELLPRLRARYGLDATRISAEDFVVALADKVFMGDKDKAGVRILNDYRNGALGPFALELPGDKEARVAKAANAAQAAKDSPAAVW